MYIYIYIYITKASVPKGLIVFLTKHITSRLSMSATILKTSLQGFKVCNQSEGSLKDMSKA
jgi:hypothetical protein